MATAVLGRGRGRLIKPNVGARASVRCRLRQLGSKRVGTPKGTALLGALVGCRLRVHSALVESHSF